jgi:tRNA A-37 threonylcarbamoyl transferase component Bud32/Tol biopolymer transport system component
MGFSAGARLGPYEIVCPIGAGGMGEVYRARDTRLDRTVAIKVLNSALSATPDLKARFEREAKTISQFNHPNICVLHDIGHDGEVDYLVMEFLDGESLADRIRNKGALPLPEVIKIGSEIADALDKAHRAGIVHRDLKPGNVMLTKTGAKLLDFGLAKPAAVRGAVAGSAAAPLLSAAMTMTSPNPQHSPLTQQGSLVGTVQYMSPEQIQGLEADARSDIFALGAVLYEMTTGKRAFEGKSQLSVASAIIEKEPEPLTSLNPQVPSALVHTIETCLAKNPDDRWQNARDVARELAWAAVRQESMPSRAAAPPRTMWLLVAALALLLVIAVVSAVRLYTRPAAESWKLQVDLGSDTIADVEAAGGLQLSPDGSWLAFVTASEPSRLAVRNLKTGRTEDLKGTEGAAFPFWSADGRSLGFFAAEKLKTITLEQGTVQVVADAPAGRGGSWNSDGQIVFTPNIQESLYVVSDSGGTPRRVTPPTNNQFSDRVPAFLPDGKHFIFTRQLTGFNANDTHLQYDILVGSLEGMSPQKVATGEYDTFLYAAGRLYFARGRGLFTQDFSLRTYQLSGRAIKIADDVETYHGRALASFGVSQTGLIAYRTTPVRFRDVVWLDRSGRIETAFAGTAKAWSGTGDFSFDSRKTALCEPLGSVDICATWLLDFQTRSFSRLPIESVNSQAVFTPRGEALVYLTVEGNLKRYDLTSGAVDDFGKPSSAYATVTDTTPNGDAVLTIQRPATANDVVMLSLQHGATPRDVLATAADEVGQELSPNGKWLPVCRIESGTTDLVVVAFPDGHPQWHLATAACRVTWRADGRELYYQTGQKVFAMPVRDPDRFELAPAQLLFEMPPNIGGGAMLPDGKHFLGFRSTGASSGGEINVLVNWQLPKH